MKKEEIIMFFSRLARPSGPIVEMTHHGPYRRSVGEVVGRFTEQGEFIDENTPPKKGEYFTVLLYDEESGTHSVGSVCQDIVETWAEFKLAYEQKIRDAEFADLGPYTDRGSGRS